MIRHLWNAYRARRAGKHPDDLDEFLEHMEQNAQNDVIREFARDAQEKADGGISPEKLQLEKDGVDFDAEATVMFWMGVMWERHDIYTGDDL